MTKNGIGPFFDLEDHEDYYIHIVKPNFERWRSDRSGVNFMNFINAIYGLREWVKKSQVSDPISAFMSDKQPDALVEQICAARRHGIHGRPDGKNPPELKKANAFVIGESLIDDPDAIIGGRYMINDRPADDLFREVMDKLIEIYQTA